ncbi:hypothetical protein N2152v2_009313 [Parachlorella kessleri]
MALGAAEVEYITQGVEADMRNDGRKKEDFRAIELQLGVIAQASGSARLRLGNTDVIVGVKVEIGSPDPDMLDCGRLAFSVECSPVASSAFQGRGGEELGAELTRSLERALYPGPTGRGGGVDLSQLSIVAGKTCWVLYVDALVLNIDGNVLDALSLAAKAALADTRIPKVEVTPGEDPTDEPDYEVDDDPAACSRLNVQSVPVIVTVSQIGRSCAVDPTAAEELCSSAALQARVCSRVAVDSSGRVCGLTKRRQQALDPAILLDMVDIAQRLGPRLHKALDAFVLSL